MTEREDYSAKATPGPWRSQTSGEEPTVNSVDGWLIATCNKTVYIGNAYWNADLIAAAPELLAALKMYVKLDDERHAGIRPTATAWADCHQAAMAAIATAEWKS